jgi:hypothetical protein
VAGCVVDDAGGVDGRDGGRGISAVRDSKKSYCFCVEMICLLYQLVVFEGMSKYGNQRHCHSSGIVSSMP